MKTKGQVFTGDLFFGILIFLIVLVITIDLWDTAYTELRRAEDAYEMNWIAETISDQLVQS